METVLLPKPEQDHPVNRFSHHCVCLNWTDQEVTGGIYLPTTSECLSVTAFVASVRGRWFMITAGHVLKAIEQRLASGRRITTFGISDHWHQTAAFRDAVPFDYENAIKGMLDDDELGVDFGFIEVGTLVSENLKANGVIPINEERWMNVPLDLEFFYVLGLPTERKSVKEQRSLTGAQYKQRASLLAHPVRRMMRVPKTFRSSLPRFYGQLFDDGNATPLTDVDGMSGGAIFGFRRDFEKTGDYWLVAVQSCWWPQSRVIAGCLSWPGLGSLAKMIDRLEAA